jgi:hypothetical protein
MNKSTQADWPRDLRCLPLEALGAEAAWDGKNERVCYLVTEALFCQSKKEEAKGSRPFSGKSLRRPTQVSAPSFIPGQPIGAVIVGGLNSSLAGQNSFGPDGNAPLLGAQNIFTGSDDITMVRGRHALKFGHRRGNTCCRLHIRARRRRLRWRISRRSV